VSTATANLAMKPKSLLLIFGGMTLSFALILGVMLAAVSPDPKPRRKTTRARVVEETSAPRPTTARPRPAPRPRPQSKAPPAVPVAEEPPTIASETLPAPIAPAPPAERQTPIAPNKVAMQQLGSLKKDLKRELQALKKDRDAMLKSLAQALVALPAAEIAREITVLDDRSATTVLRQFSPQVRGKVLSRLEPKRAQKLKRRLK
jgi:hypothetical protein